MKKIIITSVITLLSLGGLSAQTLMTGEKAPDMKVAKWLKGSDPKNGAVLTEFFFSQSEPSQKRLPVLNDLAKRHGDKLNIVVISKEDESKIAPIIDGKDYSFSVALDDGGKTFSSYGVQYVPFCVLTDSKGRVVWFGNSSQLTNEIISKAQ